ncbi:hypothetical protein PoB_002680500 [Plakobranchus ocellatus]|uniref:Uncharacterized protein n=1 Tax=Plakobranchus ocellatus TaxID=259542 RepID=A0AAV4A056_9GAST|nr:hypothetical protein PoB_002680500 [Plakobranchus ocellatus]
MKRREDIQFCAYALFIALEHPRSSAHDLYLRFSQLLARTEIHDRRRKTLSKVSRLTCILGLAGAAAGWTRLAHPGMKIQTRVAGPRLERASWPYLQPQSKVEDTAFIRHA